MRHGHFVAAAALSAHVVSAVPGFPQSHTVHNRDVAYSPIASADLRTTRAVRAYDPSPNVYRPVAVPPNLDVTSLHRALVEQMLERSPTFRRQCLRIAAAPSLTVTIRTRHVSASAGVRAQTQFVTTPSSRLHAVVEIIAMQDLAELIAHELEHVIEQLDGVDLRVRAAEASTGVRHTGGGSFETVRAVRVGRAVAAETAGHRR